MQTQAGPVPVRAGLQPQFWKLWQKGVRHTLALLPFGHTSWLAGPSFPSPGHSSGRAESPPPGQLAATPAGGQLQGAPAAASYFFSYLKHCDHHRISHRTETCKTEGLSPAARTPPPSGAAPSVCFYGHKAAYVCRESHRSAGVRLRGPVFSTRWRWAVQSKLCPDPPDAVVWPCLCPVHAAHDREFRMSCLSWVRMFLWVVSVDWNG